MNKFLSSGLALGLGFANVDPARAADKDAVKGAAVTITGCVVSNKESSFVLTNVEEVAGPSSTAPNATLSGMSGLKGGTPGALYWLSDESVKLSRSHGLRP